MDYLIYLVYPMMLVLLFYKSSVSKRGEWNDEVLSLKQTKALQAYASICIMLHHIALTTCDKNVVQEFHKDGLNVFLPAGYLCVAIFFFCSGYGLYKSNQQKEHYLDGFLGKKCELLITALFTSSVIFVVVRSYLDERISMSQPFTVGGPYTANPYAWYMYAILILYISYYIAKKYCKTDKMAFLVIGIISACYMAFCIYWMYGDWWYNTIPLFLIGILVAKYEQPLFAKIKANYIVCCILSIIGFVITFVIAEFLDDFYKYFQIENENYNLFLTIYLFGKIGSGILFVFMITILGMKIKIGNKPLYFLGNYTLEFYLFHGLFVQLFSHCFLREVVKSAYYIRNVFIRVIITLMLSVLFAVMMKKLHDLIHTFLHTYVVEGTIARLCKRIAIIVVILLIVLIPLLSVSNRNKTKEMVEQVKAYQDDNIRFVTVEGSQMATYVTGEGSHTLVILPETGNICPTLSFRALADELSKQYKVVLLDYLGTGFSEAPQTDRTSEQIAKEIHEALQALGITTPVVLMPYGESGIEAMQYSKLYREDVEAIIGINMDVPNYMQEQLVKNDISKMNYIKMCEKQGTVGSHMHWLLNKTGYITFELPVIDECMSGLKSAETTKVFDELFKTNYMNETMQKQMIMQCENYLSLTNETFAEDLPVHIFVDRGRYHEKIYGGYDWPKLYEETFSNRDIQEVDVILDLPRYVFYDVSRLSRMITKTLNK